MPYFLRVSWIFLSTPSMRRATLDGRAAAVFHLISIHALREEGDRLHRQIDRRSAISIHALREEGDMQGFQCNSYLPEFLSTPSARRATV